MIKELNVVEPGDVVYLWLPLCHVFARLVQLVAYDLGERSPTSAATRGRSFPS